LIILIQLVSWSLMTLFSTYPLKEGKRYINLNNGCLFVQQPPKKKKKGSRGSFKLLRWCLQQGETTITLQDETKSNTTKKSMHP